jgi:hypothetical protein
MTRGRCGSLRLHRLALSSVTPRRFYRRTKTAPAACALRPASAGVTRATCEDQGQPHFRSRGRRRIPASAPGAASGAVFDLTRVVVRASAAACPHRATPATYQPDARTGQFTIQRRALAGGRGRGRLQRLRLSSETPQPPHVTGRIRLPWKTSIGMRWVSNTRPISSFSAGS